MPRLINTTCPWCLISYDAATGLRDIAPRPGDLVVCRCCHNLSSFDDDLSLARADESVLDMDTRAMIRQVRYALMGSLLRN